MANLGMRMWSCGWDILLNRPLTGIAGLLISPGSGAYKQDAHSRFLGPHYHVKIAGYRKERHAGLRVIDTAPPPGPCRYLQSPGHGRLSHPRRPYHALAHVFTLR